MPDRFADKKFGTRAVHQAQPHCPVTGAIKTPIYQTTSYIFENVADGAAKCESNDAGYCYTRLGNPTQQVLENKLAALENGEAALAFASGMAAISSLLLSVLKQGDQVVADATSYSATHYMLDNLLKKFGVKTTFVDTADPKAIAEAVTEKTALIYCETPANPTLKLVDLEKVARIGREKEILTVVDSTFASPYLQKPLDLGMDAVVHSCTKYLCGHGDAMGGVVVGTKAFIDGLRDDTLKNMGAIIAPFNAFLLLRGINTLEVRMERHCKNAMAVARFLSDHPKIRQVWYPGLPSHPQHELAKRQMKDFGGMICFEVAGGIEAGVSLMNNVRVCTLAVSVGHVETLVEHPASMTHWYVPKEEREKSGITDGLVRLSVGIESAKDIMDDLDRALNM